MSYECVTETMHVATCGECPLFVPCQESARFGECLHPGAHAPSGHDRFRMSDECPLRRDDLHIVASKENRKEPGR